MYIKLGKLTPFVKRSMFMRNRRQLGVHVDRFPRTGLCTNAVLILQGLSFCDEFERHLYDVDQYGAGIRARCKYAAEAAQVAAMIKQNALKQRALEQSDNEETKPRASDDRAVKADV
jgi:hypothetical protein